MDLNLKKEGTYKYDAASLGEVMLRLDPGEGRIRTARSFTHGKAAESTMSSAVSTSALAWIPLLSQHSLIMKSASS